MMKKNALGTNQKKFFAKVKNKRGNQILSNFETAKNKTNLGITLIALVVTIVVLLILARSKYCNFNRRQPEY